MGAAKLGNCLKTRGKSWGMALEMTECLWHPTLDVLRLQACQRGPQGSIFPAHLGLQSPQTAPLVIPQWPLPCPELFLWDLPRLDPAPAVPRPAALLPSVPSHKAFAWRWERGTERSNCQDLDDIHAMGLRQLV